MRVTGLAFALPLALAATTLPLAAKDDVSSRAATLERNLRTCLVTGAPGAPRTSLLHAVVALRALCARPLTQLRAYRLEQVDAGFAPDAELTLRQREKRESARDAARTRLNDEFALAVANFTGLTS